MADVFISYASDDRALAGTLARALEASGYSVWWDRNLHGGADFASEIERELSAARAVIVLWSAKSRDSPWVRDEAAVARDAGKLVPVRLDDVAAPLGFRQLQAVDLIGWNGDEQDAAYAGLLASLRHFVTAAAQARPPTTASKAPRGRTRNLAIAAAAVLVAMAVGFALLWRQPTVPPPATQQSANWWEDLANWTVEVRPFTTPTDGSLDAVAGIARNELVRSLSARDLTIQLEPAPGATGSARHRLEGAVRRTGDSISLTLQLVAAASGGIVWTDEFPLATATPTFERARQAAALIDTTVFASAWGSGLATRSETARSEFVATIREVYRLWYTADGNWLVAVRHAENALRADPSIRDAHMWLGTLYANRLGYSIRADAALPIALRHAQRALAFDPDYMFPLGQTNVVLELDYATGIKNLERARSPLILDANIDRLIGSALLAQGRLQEALAILQAAAARGGSLYAEIGLAHALELAGRTGEARSVLERGLSTSADESWFGLQALLLKIRVCHADGDLPAANDALDRAWRAHGAERPEWFPGALALVGRTDDARRILAEAETRFMMSPLAYSTGAFEGAFQLGDFDRAFVWLERAIDNRELVLFGDVRLSPRYAPLRADPRFAAAMARLEAIEKPSPR